MRNGREETELPLRHDFSAGRVYRVYQFFSMPEQRPSGPDMGSQPVDLGKCRFPKVRVHSGVPEPFEDKNIRMNVRRTAGVAFINFNGY